MNAALKDIVLETRDLHMAFGGLVVFDKLNFCTSTRRAPRHHRPERRGQDDVCQHGDGTVDSRGPARFFLTAR